MEETTRKLAVLYADVSGSTKLYEKWGDTIARADVHVCIELLSKVANEQNGEIVKTIGDEVMCVFDDPVNAAVAASEMHRTLNEASETGDFQSGELHVKIGWHYGPVYYRGDEILGEAPVTAQQVIRLANADEILTTGKSLDELPEELKTDARFIDEEKAQAWDGDVKIYALPWEEEEEEDATQFSGAPNEGAVLGHSKLVLEHAGKEYKFDKTRTPCRIGRGEDNELSVQGKYTSRHHAEIEYRHGRFHLVDMSTNGTVLVDANNKVTRLRRENIILGSNGVICFGGTPEEDPSAVVHFRCE